ncbi:MAG: murein L,D-transpeptidase catalytic domain-containing protein [Cytophagaceae bacterium]
MFGLIRLAIIFTFALFLSCSGNKNKELTLSEKSDNGLLTSFFQNSPDKKSSFVDTEKLLEAKAFCEKRNLDTTLAIFIDMGIHSGKYRFFIYDLQNEKILHKGLCCHGAGKGSTCEKPVFSNEKGSNCTSLGKYKLGVRSYSNWGINIHYKMHGLEETNKNAFSRIVVLHSYDPVPDSEIYPLHLPMGWSLGCPVVSNDLMRKIDELLKDRKTEVLLWIYNV